ncbi:MAG: FAD-dependent oxidoreductase [Deltaproteobacteria bacterium]|nr:FAD-dependent oxidoreductase [Deltaproteobacteria bacterium]
MNQKTSSTHSYYDADIVVVGAGGAGLTAAAAGAEKGARVIIIDKRKPGGSSAMAKGFLAAESPFQKRAMIHTPKDLVYKIAMEYGHLKMDPRIVRAFVNKSGDTAGWLEKMGITVGHVSPSYIDQEPLTWHIVDGGGDRVITQLKRYCAELGVQILPRTEAKNISHHKGRITGVTVIKGGLESVIRTNSVILATGGYGGNKELLKKYCSIYHDGMPCIGVPNMGDGVVMATSLGAATEGLGVLQLAGPFYPERTPIMINGKEIIMPLAAIGFEPNIVWVNKKGERFIDETVGGDHFESAYAVVRQPDMVAFIIADSGIIQTMEAQGLIAGQGKYKEIQRRGMPGLPQAIRSVVHNGRTLVSESWDEIASWMGAEPQTLKNTIEEYNACCDQGYDPIFAKERQFLIPLRTPPYYAMKGDIRFLGTIGGIKINHHMEVIDLQGYPIPGLFAAGVDTGGWTGDNYCGKLPGTTFGFALNSGRIAGENAAIFVLKGASKA